MSQQEYIKVNIKEMITIEEVCQQYPKVVNPRTMRNWIAKAKKDPNATWHKKIGKKWFVDVERFFEWMDKK